MKITNGDLMNVLEKAKVKMKDIQNRNTKLINPVYAEDLINRMALCVYDIAQMFMKK